MVVKNESYPTVAWLLFDLVLTLTNNVSSLHHKLLLLFTVALERAEMMKLCLFSSLRLFFVLFLFCFLYFVVCLFVSLVAGDS